MTIVFRILCENDHSQTVTVIGMTRAWVDRWCELFGAAGEKCLHCGRLQRAEVMLEVEER